MLLALDGHIGAEGVLEKCQFRGTEQLALAGGVADGAVVLDQKQAAVRRFDDFGHVAFGGALPSECVESVAERRRRRDDALQRFELAPRSGLYDPGQAAVAERGPYAGDEVERQGVVTVGEKVLGEGGEAPEIGGTAAAARFGGRAVNEALALKVGEVLSGGDQGDAELPGDALSLGGTVALQVVDDAAFRVAGLGLIHVAKVSQRALINKYDP